MTEQTTFMIWNMVRNEVVVEAPTAEGIERAYHNKWAPPRTSMDLIVEIPKVLGLNIHTYRNFPQSFMFDGAKLYASRKAGVS